MQKNAATNYTNFHELARELRSCGKHKNQVELQFVKIRMIRG